MDLDKLIPFVSQNMLGLAFLLATLGTIAGKLGGQLLGHHKDLLAANENLRRQAIAELKDAHARLHELEQDLVTAIQSLRQGSRQLSDVEDQLRIVTRQLEQCRAREDLREGR